MRVIITGGNGFIGCHLIRHLFSQGLDIKNLSRQEGYDLSDDCLQDVGSADAVIHLAAKTFVPDSRIDPKNLYKENFISTLNLLEHSRQNGIKKFVYLSSYVYGKPTYLPINEDHPLNINNPYGRSKLLCESLCKSYAEDFGMNIIIVRPFNVYGWGQDSRFLLPTIINQAMDVHTDKIMLRDLKPKRDFLYIKDLVIILDKILKEPSSQSPSVLNLGLGKSYSVKDIATKLLDVFNIQKNLIQKGSKRENETDDCYADISYVKERFSWSPAFDIDEGLKDMYLSLGENQVNVSK